MTRLLQALWDGLSIGSIYALLALGFVLIFKATSVVNFAHGAIASVGAFFVATFAVERQIPGRWTGGPDWFQWGLSVLMAIVVAAAVGLALERVAIRPMVGEPLFSIVIITLGIDIVLRSFVNDFLGTSDKAMGNPFGIETFEVASVRIPHTQVVSTLSALACFAAVGFFFKSRMGIAMRATAFDQEAAMAQGVNVGRMSAVAWGMAASLAAVAGTFLAIFPVGSGNLTQGTALFALRAFPAVILGGLDSIKGAIVGGFIIGTLEVLAGEYLKTYDWLLGEGYQTVVPYFVMLVVLLVRPYGLFGTPEVRRV